MLKHLVVTPFGISWYNGLVSQAKEHGASLPPHLEEYTENTQWKTAHQIKRECCCQLKAFVKLWIDCGHYVPTTVILQLFITWIDFLLLFTAVTASSNTCLLLCLNVIFLYKSLMQLLTLKRIGQGATSCRKQNSNAGKGNGEVKVSYDIY